MLHFYSREHVQVLALKTIVQSYKVIGFLYVWEVLLFFLLWKVNEAAEIMVEEDSENTVVYNFP